MQSMISGAATHPTDPFRLALVQVGAAWGEFGWGDLNEPGPQTEDSIERGFRLWEPVDEQMGRSDGIDPDNVGDIADETPGRRG